jgi:DNA repair protein SbcD/Mre11
VAGDLYDTASPTADATRIVTRALSALRSTGADVVAIGGNHDNGPALDALRSWADAAGIILRGAVREAHTIMGYAVPATVFPAAAHYVALGHLHRAQTVPGPAPTRYCGSPLAVDFGEEENVASVSIVEVTATTAAKVRDVPIEGPAPLHTVRGTLAHLSTLDTGDAWLRVYVAEAPRAGLREEVQDLLPRALEVRIDPRMLPDAEAGQPRVQRVGRSPGELFADYLAQKGHADEATVALFHRLHEEVTR